MFILLFALFNIANCDELNISRKTAREVLQKRYDHYWYFSTNSIEDKLSKVNKQDANSINEYINFEGDPDDVDLVSGDQVCISNTFFSLVFTIFTFSSACSIVVATQLLNISNKREILPLRKQPIESSSNDIELMDKTANKV